MKRYISVLRGINVGGKRKILMLDLKELFLKLGYEKVITYIQSGNVIFDSLKNETNLEISENIRKKIFETYGFEVPVIVRSFEETEKIVKANPYLLSESIEKLHVTLLNGKPNPAQHIELEKICALPDEYKILDLEVYIKCCGKYSDSKLTNNFLEKKLQVRATTRNWKTFTKLYELAKNT